MILPSNHPLRVDLNDEVHARPPEALVAPSRISYLVLLSGWAERERERQAVEELASRFGVAGPAPGANHYSADFGPFRIKFEQHTEFARYTFIIAGEDASAFDRPAIDAVPAGWVAALPGTVVMAAHVALVAADASADLDALSQTVFSGNLPVGSAIAGGAATALTDFRIHADGFSRIVVQDHGMAPRQAGRMVQCLLEIDTYRVMALLALPIARELGPFLTGSESELAQITTALVGSDERQEPQLLERLTKLEAEIGSRQASHHYRFAAAGAYNDLVRRRIDELRETRIRSLQTFDEFTERRLAPAMNTCRAVASRLDSLSERMARATQLLSTRVDVTRERQNQTLLASMDRRAKLQLRLQETVEGLSLAAITYYFAGLIGYAAKGLKSLGMPFEPDLVVGASIPIVFILTAVSIRRFRRMATSEVP